MNGLLRLFWRWWTSEDELGEVAARELVSGLIVAAGAILAILLVSP